MITPLEAQESGPDRFRSIAQSCISIIDASNDATSARVLTRPLADELDQLASQFNRNNMLLNLLPDLNENAAACVGFSRQLVGKILFSPELERFVPERQMLEAQAAETQAREIERALNQARDEQKRILELARIEQERRDQLDQEINRRVFEACSNLESSSPNLAYTNGLCISSFRTNGLPNQ